MKNVVLKVALGLSLASAAALAQGAFVGLEGDYSFGSKLTVKGDDGSKIKFKKGAKIGVVLSGGNIDVQVLSIIIEKGLIKSHRKMTLQITLVDKPGALMSLTDSLKSANANIVKIDYDRFSTKLDYGDASITITLETKGLEHQEKIKDTLNKNGFSFTQLF